MLSYRYTLIAFLLLLPLNTVSGQYAGTRTPSNQASAFLDSNIIAITFTGNFICSPPIQNTYPNASNAANYTCGIKSATSVLGTLPVWALYPSFAGLSIYGFNETGSKDGYAVYKGNVIVTDCGAGGSATECAYNPAYLYSASYPQIQNVLIQYGINGLPYGFLPMPAHNLILLHAYANKSISWYLIAVRVFDPNIFPDARTGICKQTAPSNLSRPTANCLTSFDAIVNAFDTKNSYISQINKNNPIWIGSQNTLKQIAISMIPVNSISGILYPNTNAYFVFEVERVNIPTTLSIAQRSSMIAEDSRFWVITIGILGDIILIANLWWFGLRNKKKKTYGTR